MSPVGATITFVSNPVAAFSAAGLSGLASAVLAEVDDPGTWDGLTALGLMGVAFLLLLGGVIRGDIIHIKSKEREEKLAEIAIRPLERERIHEASMTAAVDRLVEEHPKSGTADP